MAKKKRGILNKGGLSVPVPPPVHCPRPLPAVSECSFDGLSLQERLEEFLVGLFGLPAQLLFPLPPQNLQESHSHVKRQNRRGITSIWKKRAKKKKKTSAQAGYVVHGTYQSLFLQQRRVPVKHKDRPDAEEEQLADAVEESEEVGVLDTVTFTVPHPLHCLVQPYTDV